MDVGKLTTWLKAELKTRDWTRADLARKSGLSESFISLFFAGKRDVGFQSIVAISSALRVTPTQVFEAAGLLPESKSNHWIESMILLLGHVSNKDREAVETILRAYAKMGEK